MFRKRQYPIVGDGGGYFSWIHLDDAAAATMTALEHEGPAIYNIVDDEPAPVREWLPVLAKAVGADPPRRLPVWLARLLAGDVAVMMITEGRGASNAKAKRELGLRAQVPELAPGILRRVRAAGRSGEEGGRRERRLTYPAGSAIVGSIAVARRSRRPRPRVGHRDRARRLAGMRRHPRRAGRNATHSKPLWECFTPSNAGR